MRLLEIFGILFLFSLVFLNCSGIKPCIRETREKDRRMQAERKFDPWKMERENPVIIQDEESAEPQEQFSRSVWGKDETGEAKVSNEALYRIQIFASKFPEEAQNLVSSLESEFDEPVNIVYETPYYKVRLGDFETMKEAESFLRKIRQRGFPQAWVVKIKKEERKEDDQD